MTIEKTADKIPVLAYHKVINNITRLKYARGATISVAKYKFNAQMKYLRDHNFRTINCDEFYAWYKGELDLPEKTVMITFDDAFYECYYVSAPILKKYNLKSTIFIVGKNTKETTDPFVNDYKRHYIGNDILEKMKTEYPLIEFQGHSYGYHRKTDDIPRIAGKPVKDIVNDYKKMIDRGYVYTAHPYGFYTEEMKIAAPEAGIKLGFGYGVNNYATREDDMYNISRIKVSGNNKLETFISYVEKTKVF